MEDGLKGRFNFGEINPKKTISFKRTSPNIFSLEISNFESHCEVVMDTEQVKNLILKMVSEL